MNNTTKKLEDTYNKINVLINSQILNAFKTCNESLSLLTNSLLNNINSILTKNNVIFDENKFKVIMFDSVINQLNPELSILINNSKDILTEKNNNIYSKLLSSISENNIVINEELNNIKNPYNYNIINNIWNNYMDQIFINITLNDIVKNQITNEVNKSKEETINLFNNLNKEYVTLITNQIQTLYNDVTQNKEEIISNLEILEF